MYEKVKPIALNTGSEKKQYTIVFVMIILLFVVATYFTKFNPFEILGEQNIFWSFILDDFLPPDILEAKGLWSSLLTTLQMALASTFLAACLSFVLAFFGSSTTAPSLWIAKIIRAVGSFMRNIPPLIWSFILVMAFGIGTTVGVLALFLGTFGFLIRAYIETIDELGYDSLEALNSVGANFFQKLAQGIVPAAIPGYISWFLYSIEVNIRASTIVGMVGGGGIGLVLMSYIKSFKYSIACAVIIAIAMLVILVDVMTNWLRRRIIA